jgi:hypothetical protein
VGSRGDLGDLRPRQSEQGGAGWSQLVTSSLTVGTYVDVDHISNCCSNMLNVFGDRYGERGSGYM